MSVILQRMRARAGIAWLLLAPLLLLRVLVPAGFMPTVAADQSITMQICARDTARSPRPYRCGTAVRQGPASVRRAGALADKRPFAQMPPLELRTSLDHESGPWSGGVLWRVAARQDRSALTQGNVVGQDLGPTPGFGVLSLNAAWRPVAGHEQTIRVNEPGRTLWLKASAEF